MRYANTCSASAFGMLQVRENEISLRNWSRGAAHLRTSEGTLLAPPSPHWRRPVYSQHIPLFLNHFFFRYKIKPCKFYFW